MARVVEGSRVTRRLIWAALALFAFSLMLPVAYGAEIWGVMSGGRLLFAILAIHSGLTMLVGLPSYLSLLFSLLIARRSHAWAAVFAGLALLLPAYLLATQGLFIDAFLSHRRIFASGLLCWIASALLMAVPWTMAVLRRDRNVKVVTDVHSQLNPTQVHQIVFADSLETIQRIIGSARDAGRAICVAGGRHAMGAQQFGTDADLLDVTKLNRVLRFDPHNGTIDVEAGITWPELVEYLLATQEGQPRQWGIAQKQTGVDRVCLGGAIAANVHGRGLRMKPIIADVDSLQVVDADGNLLTCGRQENAELFRLVIGGYGLFGVVYSVTLRLVPRQKVQRVVQVIPIDDLISGFEQRIADGFLYGDFQYVTDEKSDDFLRRGVFSCYRPVDPETRIPRRQKQISERNWYDLVYLGHVDKARAFQLYADYYRSTSGQIYWSDTHQLSAYLDGYHRRLDCRLGASDPATEVITEISVPRQTLTRFMDQARDALRKSGVSVIYGTIRLIERDDESFLAWAKQPYACVIFNLHTVHTPAGLKQSADAFRRLIDLGIGLGGTYYLTYHKYATREQVEACYPQFGRFLCLKKAYDPEERFQSDWYRHYKRMFADLL
jgi:FAD/FMN-containing dehydrogenase